MNGDEREIDISIIIVNYNVKEFLANLLASIQRATHHLNLEIFVVDNASSDGSVDYLKSRYPEVQYIKNEENRGFGRANNQAIKKAKGKYTLLINPDAIVREDTLLTMYKHMEEHPDCGAAGCKILNPDGSYAPESRRSIPTIWSALCKLLGLSTLFPDSPYFNQYYVNGEEPDMSGSVPVLSGSFMFFRTKVLKDLGGFDERFFMYGEDIDLCYRVHQNTGYHIDYLADTSIIHYKGESTKKDNIGYIKNFNKALYLFFEKHYTYRYSLMFRMLIYIGIFIRAVVSFLKNKAYTYQGVIIDALIINATLFIAFPVRFDVAFLDLFYPPYADFFWINFLVTLLYVAFANSFGVVKRDPYIVIDSLKSVLATYTGVVFITFFIRTLAFSRLVLLASGVMSFVLIGLIRVWRKNAHKNPKHSRGRIRPTRVLIVGKGDKTGELIDKINSRVDWDYEIAGVIAQEDEFEQDEKIHNISVIGSLEQLPDLINSYSVDQLLFLLNAVSYKQVLHILTELSDQTVVSKLVPDSMDFMLGKSNVEYLADIPLIDLELSYQNTWNRFVKRSLELAIVVPVFVVLTPILGWGVLFKRKNRSRLSISENGNGITLSLFKPLSKHCWKNLYLMFGRVVKGDLRLVGAPLWPPIALDYYGYEYGITGLAQINTNRIFTQEDREQFDLYYLQNYSLWQDLDIVARTIFNGPCPCSYLEKQLDLHPGSTVKEEAG